MANASSSKKIEKSEIRKILIRSTNWVGDVVMTLPALDAIRENFPGSSITVLAKPWVIPLFENHPAVDDIITFRKGNGFFRSLSELSRVIRTVRRGKFDLAVLFQNAFEAALITFLAGVKIRVGYNTDGRGFLLSHPIKKNDEASDLHQVEYYLSILGTMGWDASYRDPSVHIAQEDNDSAEQLLRSSGARKDGFILGLGPGAIFGDAKRWPPDRFGKIGDWAVKKWEATVLLFGSKKEREICEVLEKTMGNIPLNVCGKTTLGQAMGLISRCDMFVTNDSGLMHIAAAIGVPTLAIFGSTDPVATGPKGPKAQFIVHQTDCAPCLEPNCSTDFRCMLSVQPEEVWKQMEMMKEEFE